MSYIIKNCDNLRNTAKITVSGFKEDKKEICIATHKKCAECSNCLLKQIVERSKHMQNEFTPDLLSDKYPDKYKFFKSARADAGKEILSLLEIKEK